MSTRLKSSIAKNQFRQLELTTAFACPYKPLFAANTALIQITN
jgi:hypothetical protein